MYETGCPFCAEKGFNYEKPAILYYIRIETRIFLLYKIGITNRTVEDRFSGEMDKITILNVEHFTHGIDAYNKEQDILKKYSEYHFTGIEKILEKGGNTELFTKDILELDPSN